MKRWLVVLSIVVAGCTKPPAAPESSVARVDAQRAAAAVALVTGGRICSVAPTGSMVPTFDANAYLVTEPVRLANVRLGDIVVRSDGPDGRLIVHRVVSISARGAVTRGDANEAEDAGYADDTKLSGRVVAIVYGSR